MKSIQTKEYRSIPSLSSSSNSSTISTNPPDLYDIIILSFSNLELWEEISYIPTITMDS